MLGNMATVRPPATYGDSMEKRRFNLGGQRSACAMMAHNV